MNIFKNIEPNKKVRISEIIIIFLLIISSLFCFIKGNTSLKYNNQGLTFVEETIMYRDESLEDYDEDNTVCDVTYVLNEDSFIVSYSYEDYLKLDSDQITAYKFKTNDDINLFFKTNNPTNNEISEAYRTVKANQLVSVFNLSISLIILALTILIVTLFSKSFTLYEKIWFVSIMLLATIIAYLFPEEDANGINGIVIMFLYLLDTFLNILCELLISKQSRYNFLVSVLVEITEIAVCLVLMYRFATLVVTLFFWLPIDIISFINWSKHKDDEEDELTIVRKLTGYQEILIIIAIILWTIVVGYVLSGIDVVSDFFHEDKQLETLIIYLDACASAVGVANGLFIFFRLREQWIAWYICAALEAIMNILTGQYVLLVLKLGYFTNTTYGYLKWSKYISSHQKNKQSIF